MPNNVIMSSVDESSIQRKGVNVILWHCCQVLSPMKTIANGARLPLLHLPLVQACQTKPFPNKDVKERELLLLCPDGKIWSTNHAHILFWYSCRLEIDLPKVSFLWSQRWALKVALSDPKRNFWWPDQSSKTTFIF